MCTKRVKKSKGHVLSKMRAKRSSFLCVPKTRFFLERARARNDARAHGILICPENAKRRKLIAFFFLFLFVFTQRTLFFANFTFGHFELFFCHVFFFFCYFLSFFFIFFPFFCYFFFFFFIFHKFTKNNQNYPKIIQISQI